MGLLSGYHMDDIGDMGDVGERGDRGGGKQCDAV